MPNAAFKSMTPKSYSKISDVSSIKARLVIQEKVKKVSKKGKRKANLPSQTNRGASRLEDKSKKTRQSGSDSVLSKYLNDIRELILEKKYKSPVASRLNLTGTSVLSFKVQYPDKLKEVKIIKSSGKAPLDESALETIRRIEKIPPIPPKLELVEITMTLEMVFE